jgi:hypothetical protein
MGLRQIRFELKRAATRDNCFLELTSFPQRVAQVVVGLRIVGFELERAAISGDGLVEPACRAAGFAEIAMSGGIIRVEDDGLANPLHREVMAADLVSDETQEVQCVGMVRLHRKDLAVDPFGFGQSSCAMMLKSQIQGLWNCHNLNLRPSLSARDPLSNRFVGNGMACLMFVDVAAFHGVVENVAQRRPLQIARRKFARPNWQKSIATHCLQQSKRRRRSKREKSWSHWPNMLLNVLSNGESPEIGFVF